MKKVDAYKLSNGQIIEDETLAIELQKNLDLTKGLRDFADKHGCYSDGKEALFNAINENSEELYKILQNKFGNTENK